MKIVSLTLCIAVCPFLLFSTCILIWNTWPVGVITRAVSVAADAIVLALTVWKTFYIFQEHKEARAATRITTTLAYNGSFLVLILLLLLWQYWCAFEKQVPSRDTVLAFLLHNTGSGDVQSVLSLRSRASALFEYATRFSGRYVTGKFCYFFPY